VLWLNRLFSKGLDSPSFAGEVLGPCRVVKGTWTRIIPRDSRIGQLLAMAGKGFRFPGFSEISCLHASRPPGTVICQLTCLRSHPKIRELGEKPFLHVGIANAEAIRVYEKLGFKTRRIINIAFVKRE